MTRRIIKLLISAVFWACSEAWKIVLGIFGRPTPRTCVVLYYHVVKPEERERFAKQMDMLLQLARPISLERLIAIEPGKHHVAVTFDDAFRESLRNALSELEKRSIPVTVFVPTGCLGLPAPWLSGDEYKAHGGVVMSAGELKELAKNPLVSLGSHCITHKVLPTLSDDEASEEIFRSKSDLEDILGRAVKMLSFPHGAFEQKHLTMAQGAEYQYAFSIQPAIAFTDRDEFLVGRVRVDPADWPAEFRLKLFGAYRWVPLLADQFEKCRAV